MENEFKAQITPKENKQPEEIDVNHLKHILSGLQDVNRSLEKDNKHMREEMEAMRNYIAETQTQSIFAYLNACFKVLEHSEFYDNDFIEGNIKDIQKVMGNLHSIIAVDYNNVDNGEHDSEGAQAD